MPVFKMNGREWVVKLDAPKIKDVRQQLDGFDVLDDTAWGKLYKDPVLLVDVLWVLCRSQANGMTSEQFGEALVGDAIDAATHALTEARLDFSPASERSLRRSLAETQEQTSTAAMEAALAELADPTLKERLVAASTAKMKQEIKNLLTSLNSATDSPESSESTPPD